MINISTELAKIVWKEQKFAPFRFYCIVQKEMGGKFRRREYYDIFKSKYNFARGSVDRNIAVLIDMGFLKKGSYGWYHIISRKDILIKKGLKSTVAIEVPRDVLLSNKKFRTACTSSVILSASRAADRKIKGPRRKGMAVNGCALKYIKNHIRFGSISAISRERKESHRRGFLNLHYNWDILITSESDKMFSNEGLFSNKNEALAELRTFKEYSGGNCRTLSGKTVTVNHPPRIRKCSGGWIIVKDKPASVESNFNLKRITHKLTYSERILLDKYRLYNTYFREKSLG